LLSIKGTYYGLLFWRSFTQLFGGLGIVLLFLDILPNLGLAGLEALFLMAAGIPVYDSLMARES
jgi:trk system potassium uptake protein TrkH